ncbi:MAG: hypothetical protein C3F19_07600 [Rhodocyclales bacterium]|nr:MAG: hypothetical protein C3F19_07600 [Rhodocyclales bacterium]
MADIPKNMQIFDLVTLRILERLYEAFPMPIEITPGSIGIEITSDVATSDDAWSAISVADATLPWLANEGFLRYETVTNVGTFREVQLTLKGLSILGSVPLSITQSEVPEPIIKKVKKVLTSGAEKAGADAVKAVLNEVFRLAMNAPNILSSAGGISV